MTKILKVTLVSWGDPGKLVFDMVVPVNVFATETLEITPHANMGDIGPIYMDMVRFTPRTDGTVRVEGRTTSHSRQDALEFLQRHPDVSNLQMR
jgi:hypothetical protein